MNIIQSLTGGGDGGGVVSNIFFKKMFLWVTLRLYTEFQSSTMSGFGQINFPGWAGGWVWVGLVEIKANSAKLSLVLFELGPSLAILAFSRKAKILAFLALFKEDMTRNGIDDQDNDDIINEPKDILEEDV